MEDRLRKLESKMDFIHNRMFQMVKEEVRSVLSEEGFRDYLFTIAGEFVKSEIQNIISSIIKDVFRKQTKLFKEQNQRVQDLALSIDESTKKIIREIDCSHITQKIIKDKIGNVFDKIETKTLQNIKLKQLS